MGIVSLELLKKHVRADDFAEDDAILQQYLDAAEEEIIASTYRTEKELTDIGGGIFPKRLVQAILMLAASWYDQSESISPADFKEVPNALSSLIKPFRKLSDN